jgi:hypothetical protein
MIEYQAHRASRGGRRLRCKECMAATVKAYEERVAARIEREAAMPARRPGDDAPLSYRLLHDPAMTPMRRRLFGRAVEALDAYGVNRTAAELAVDLILRGKVPGLAVHIEAGGAA